MILTPYRRPPRVAPVATFVTPTKAIDANGERVPKRRWGEFRLYVEDADRLEWWRRRIGATWCWNTRPFAWGPLGPDGPKASIIPPGASPEDVGAWARWVVERGGSPRSISGTAESLVRAHLDRRLETAPPSLLPFNLPAIFGGREEGTSIGVYGMATHYDMRAAYLQILGSLRFAGGWVKARRAIPTDGTLSFHFGTVEVPRGLVWGPIVTSPRRLRPPTHQGDWEELEFRQGVRRRGLWAGAELDAARRAGCLVKIERSWYAWGDRQPFAEFARTMLAGREEVPEGARTLVKASGNAAYGLLAMHPRSTKQVFWWEGEHQRRRDLPVPHAPVAFDVAEQVTATCRALLYEAMAAAGQDCLCVWNDGLWITGWEDHAPTVPLGDPRWRETRRASEIHYVNSRMYRWRDAETGRWQTIFAGQPHRFAERAFEEFWRTQRPAEEWMTLR